MIELKRDTLVFSFPEVHKDAFLSIEFQRTLRIPDDGKEYYLPPGLGNFPLRHVDDFGTRVGPEWLEHGGVMMPMYQAEALWINFNSHNGYPFAVKVATGKINAVSGQAWNSGLKRKPQDYVVSPTQPWLDGYCVGKGMIRQFVAMPLGSGYSAEEQITGKAEHGGIQIVAYPIKRELYKKMPMKRHSLESLFATPSVLNFKSEMGLAPGGRMKQEIYDDPHGLKAWDTNHCSRCFVHIANSMVWRQITGVNPPTIPPTSKEYNSAGLPWFDYYNEKHTAVDGSQTLSGLKSVFEKGKDKKDVPLPENESVIEDYIIKIRKGLKKGQVREFNV